jgi:hypothetical protein
MKTLKLGALSFIFGAAISVATVAAYACDDYIWVQDPNDCHMYHRYVLTGSESSGGVEVCSYADSFGSMHREDTCDGGFILS